MDYGDCCLFKFSEVVYIFDMMRRFLYYLFYFKLLSSLFMIFVLISFFIFVESGERVGFVIIILFVMIVFLFLILLFFLEIFDGVLMFGIGL